MANFLKENWIWIAAPVVVMAVLVLVALFVTGDGVAPFEYALF